MITSVKEHYEHHLASIYVWMTGGAETGIQTGADEIEALNLAVGQNSLILDLGAGFGMHSIPLARKGIRVMAIDSSAELLHTLVELRGDLPIQVVNDDLLSFQSHITEAPSAILCMGDTITHLPTLEAVDSLIETVSNSLQPNGIFVISFRDYSMPLIEEQRFIPVRTDGNRVLTCFLEYETSAVLVHDIIHERTLTRWQMKVSQYRKLQLSPQYLIANLQSNHFNVRSEAGIRGMIRLVAKKV